MKTFFSLFLCLITRISLAQVAIDPGLAERYDAAFKKAPESARQSIIHLQELLSKSPDGQPGFLIFTNYNIDTLNKNDAPKRDTSTHIYDIDTNRVTGKVEYHEFKGGVAPEIRYSPFPISVSLHHDTLSVNFGMMFPELVHKVVKGKVISYNEVYDKYDKIYRLNLNQAKTNSLKIPVNTPIFKLSRKNYKVGDVIYGEVTYIIHDYYTDNSSYKSGYIHIREIGTYLFKSVVNKPRQ